MKKKLRNLKYYFMKPKRIKKISEDLSNKLEQSDDPKERIRIMDEMFEILKIIIWRNRKDRKFMEYAKVTSTLVLLECYQKESAE